MKNRIGSRGLFHYALRAVIHDRRPNIALASALAFVIVLCAGSLSVGTSVKKSLERNSLSRLGGIGTLAQINPPLSETRVRDLSDGQAAFSYRTPVSATATDGSTTALVLYACTPEFFRLLGLNEDSVYINQTGAQDLGISAGTEFYVSVRKELDGPAVLTGGKADLMMLTFSLSASAILPDNGPGGFSENISQKAPANIFLPASLFFKKTEMDPQYNLCASSQRQPGVLSKLFERKITAQDMGWSEKTLPDSTVQIANKDLFFNPSATKAPYSFLSWFLLDVSRAGRSSPFAFAAGIPDGPLKEKIWINEELAEDLGVAIGDELAFSFYVPGQDGNLETTEARRIVEKILPMTGLGADRNLALDIPGFSDSESCSGWDTGFDIDLSRVRPQDEAYWRRYGGSPKIILGYEDAVSLFRNPWGTATALRMPQKTVDVYMANLVPKMPYQERHPLDLAVKAAQGGMDFGSLFLGLSFFILIAVAVMAGILVQLRLASRQNHLGLYGAWGIEQGRILVLESIQMGLILPLSFILSLVLVPVYTAGVLAALSSVWKEAVASASLSLNVDWPLTCVIGFAVTISFLGVYLLAFIRKARPVKKKRKPVAHPIRAFIWVFLSGGLTAVSPFIPGLGLYGYFLFSLLMMTALLAALNLFFSLSSKFHNAKRSRNSWALVLVRRRKTVLSATAILAFSVYSIGAVSGYFQKLEENTEAAVKGTGGWDYWVTTALPSAYDPSTKEGAQKAKIRLAEDANVSSVSVLQGDEAGCLNLNRAFFPSLAGVASELFSRENKFGFAELGVYRTSVDVWASLRLSTDNGEIPVLAGAETLSWSLYLKVGDVIDYPLPDGRVYKLKIVAALGVSVFEGFLVMDKDLMDSLRIPQKDFRLFLLRSDQMKLEDVNQAFSLYGPKTVSAAQRVNEYLGLQNSYLLIFAVLGFAGLFLGTLALALLTIRDVLGRTAELRLLSLSGVSPARLRLFAAFPFLAAVFFGLGAGAAAVVTASAVYASLIKSAVSPQIFILFISAIWLVGSVAIYIFAGAQAHRRELLVE